MTCLITYFVIKSSLILIQKMPFLSGVTPQDGGDEGNATQSITLQSNTQTSGHHALSPHHHVIICT